MAFFYAFFFVLANCYRNDFGEDGSQKPFAAVNIAANCYLRSNLSLFLYVHTRGSQRR